MATYSVTTTNWNSAAFWSAINESAVGHTLDFSGLPSSYTVVLDEAAGTVTLSDGFSSFVVGDSGSTASVDATMGGSTSLTFFDDIQGNGGADVIDSGTGDDTVDGSGGDDDISSGDGADFVTGGTGADTIDGGDGDDTLIGGSENDEINSGAGADQVAGGTGADTITNASGEDTIDAGSGDDSVVGSDDAETIAGGSGDDTILGGGGDDVITGDNGAELGTYAGSLDSFNFNAGNSSTGDTGNGTIGSFAYYNNIGTSSDGTPISARLTITDAGDPNIAVEFNNNSVYLNRDGQADSGTSVQLQFEFFNAVTGEPVQIDGTFTFQDVDTTAESVTANSTDVTSISTSADPLTDLSVINDGDQLGAESDSSSSQNPDQDHWAQFAVDGQQTIVFTVTSRGAGTNYGFTSADFTNPATTVAPVAGSYDDLIDAGAGNDTVYGGEGDDTIDGGADNDSLYGEAGDDSLIGGTNNGADANYLIGGEGADTLDGSAGGWDIAAYYDATSGVAVSGATGGSAGEAAGDVLIDIEQIDGSEFDDTIAGGSTVLEIKGFGGNDEITGGSNDETIYGGDGNDTVFGNGGNDTILGEDGNDSLDGDAGDDSIDGGIGDDTLIGDAGNDTLIGGEGADEVYDSNAADGGDDYVDLGAGNDTAFTGAGNDTIQGGAGNDSVFAGDGNDLIDDEFNVGTDGQGNDTFDGGAGDDTIWGGNDNDSLIGGDGNDYLGGESGADTVLGGADNDTIIGTGDDVVDGGSTATTGTDFDTLIVDNVASIDITGVDSNGNGYNGTVSFTDGTSLTFTEIEDFIVDGAPVSMDNIVSGTAADDVINPGYRDSDGTSVDGSDALGTHGEVVGSDADSIEAGGGDDVVNAGADDDTVDGGSGSDTIDGGAGDDLISGDGDGAGPNVNLGPGPVTTNLIYSVTSNGVLRSYDPATDTETELQTGLQTYGDLAITPDGQLIGIQLSGDGIIQIDPDTGVETQIATVGNGFHASLASNSQGDLFYSTSNTLSYIPSNGDGTYGAEVNIGTLPGNTTDLVFLDDATILGAVNGEIIRLTLDPTDNTLLGTETLGPVSPGQSDIWGLSVGEDGRLYAFEGSGEVHSADLSDDPYIWQLEPGSTNSGGQVYGAAGSGDVPALVPSDDSLSGGAGDDTIFGDHGNDTIDGGIDNDSLEGGSGADSVDGGDGNDTLIGDTGDDTLVGGAGNDSILAGGDDDLIIAGTGDDEAFGQGGDDTFQVDDSFGNDTVVGGETDETNGDTLDLSNLTTDATVDLTSNDPEAGTVTSGADTLTFSEIENIVLGGGRDTIVLADGSGADAVDGFDLTDSGDGTTNDQLDVSALTSDGGTTPVHTGDVVVTDDGSGNAVLTFPGGESITLIGVTPAQVDTPAELEAIGIPPEVPPGPVDGTSSGDLMQPGYVDVHGDQIDGTDGDNDTIFGYEGDDTIDGGDGDDTIDGGTGNDSIRGQVGDDSIIASTGDDTVIVTDGNDTVLGGDDADLIVVTEEAGNVVVDGGAGGTDNDTLDVSTVLDVSGWDITATGNESGTATHGSGSTIDYSEIEVIQGSSNDDNFDLTADTDGAIAIGGEGDDTMVGGSGNDNLRGRDDDDSIDGGAGDDTLDGGEGSDTILGGTGDDSITGDEDADTIILEDNFGNDTIFGGEGVTTGTDDDTLDLSVVTSDTTVDLTSADPEAGTVSDGSSTATFSEIENIVLGAGRDRVVLADGSGADAVQAFDMTDSGDGTTMDQLDVSGMTDANGAIVNTDDVVVSDDGSGNAVLTFPGGESIVLIGVTPAQLSTPAQLGSIGIPVPDYIVEGTGVGELINETYLGDPEGDVINGGDHSDGSDNDSVQAGGGDDTVFSGVGNDTVDGGTGNDEIHGGDGADSLLGGADNDTLYGGDGADTMEGGTGNDSLEGWLGDDSMLGGDGDDYLDGAQGDDTLEGGDGNDTLLAGSDDGDDLLDGGDGNDSLSAGDGEDTLIGGTGDDSMFGGGGDDVFVLEDDFGNDTIEGWSTGETVGDTLDLSSLTTDTTIDLTSADPEDGTVSDGTSTATFDDIENIILGGGRDTLVLGDGGGDDVVEAFDMTDSGDGTTNDQLNVVGLTDADGNPVDVFDVTLTDTNGDGTGDAILTFPNGESITLVGVTPDQVDSVPELNSIGIPCFTPGTMILTARGDVPVESIRPGDLVHTMDHGLQPVRWAGARKLGAEELETHPDLKPVLIRKGAFGNARKMLVSPQHAFMVDDADGERLIRAKHAAETLGGQIARKVKECDKVTYVHIMFDRHEVIFADGARSESFYPGPAALRSLDHEALTEMLMLFPDLATVALGDDQADMRFGEPARPYLLRSELRKLPRGEEGLEVLKANPAG